MLSAAKHLPSRWEKTFRFAQGDTGAVAETVTDPLPPRAGPKILIPTPHPFAIRHSPLLLPTTKILCEINYFPPFLGRCLDVSPKSPAKHVNTLDVLLFDGGQDRLQKTARIA